MYEKNNKNMKSYNYKNKFIYVLYCLLYCLPFWRGSLDSNTLRYLNEYTLHSRRNTFRLHGTIIIPFSITASTGAKSDGLTRQLSSYSVVGGNAGNADPVNPHAKSARVKSAAPVPPASIYIPCFRFHRVFVSRDTTAAMKSTRCGWIHGSVAWNGIYTSFNCRRARRETSFANST